MDNHWSLAGGSREPFPYQQPRGQNLQNYTHGQMQQQMPPFSLAYHPQAKAGQMPGMIVQDFQMAQMANQSFPIYPQNHQRQMIPIYPGSATTMEENQGETALGRLLGHYERPEKQQNISENNSSREIMQKLDQWWSTLDLKNQKYDPKLFDELQDIYNRMCEAKALVMAVIKNFLRAAGIGELIIPWEEIEEKCFGSLRVSLQEKQVIPPFKASVTVTPLKTPLEKENCEPQFCNGAMDHSSEFTHGNTNPLRY